MELQTVEEEFRSQNSGAEPETPKLRSESRRDARRLATAPLSFAFGVSPWEKTRFPRRYPPVVQKTLLNSEF